MVDNCGNRMLYHPSIDVCLRMFLGHIGNITSADQIKNGRRIGSVHERGAEHSLFVSLSSEGERPGDVHRRMTRQYGWTCGCPFSRYMNGIESLEVVWQIWQMLLTPDGLSLWIGLKSKE